MASSSEWKMEFVAAFTGFIKHQGWKNVMGTTRYKVIGIRRSRDSLRMPQVKSKIGTGAKFTNNVHSGFTEALFLVCKMCKCWEELLGGDLKCIYC